MIAQNLKAAVDNGKDVAAREAMSQAQYLSLIHIQKCISDSRTVVAVTEDKYLLLVTIDGRWAGKA